MDPARYLELLQSDGTLLADTARHDLSAPVPPCPGWTVADVVRHTGGVYRRRIEAVRLRGSEPPSSAKEAGPPPGGDLVGWYAESLAALATALVDDCPDAPAWTCDPAHQTARFWFRRMAQETAVHRVDVQSAFDDVTPVDTELAVDGVDEVLAVFLVGGARGAEITQTGATIAVRTGGHWWRVQLAGPDTSVDRAPGPADATVTAEPSELLLWLWGRRPREAVDVAGDGRAVGALRDAIATTTQ